LLGWINVESGGQHLPPTKIGELGFFQIHPGESQSLHLDHPRLATDDDYSIWGGVQLVRHYAAQAQRLGFPAGTELLWRATKWHHWLPAVVDLIMRDMRAGGVEPTRSWDAIERYVVANQNRLDDLIRARFRIPPGRDLGNWEVMVGIRNVAKTINSGKALAAGIGSP